MPSAKVNRILISAPSSNCGKTTVACALLQALKNRGYELTACKSGPDYIDPMFHSKVIGAQSRNLDMFFSFENEIRELVGKGVGKNRITVIEGAMGYYDGIAVSDTASAWDVSRATSTPTVLVVDGRGRARSIAAEILGYKQFREQSNIAGIILNRTSKMLYERLKGMIEEETGVAVFGYVPKLDDCSLESRHLGLVLADEVVDLRQKLERLACEIEKSVDVSALVELARSAPEISWEAPERIEPIGGNPRIAIARDEAFCFYYEDALNSLEELGAELVSFSPIHDTALPEGACGLYLGGGYPELHAKELSENVSMRASIAAAIEAGMPTIAECGGFMYLHEQLQTADGDSFEEASVVKGSTFPTGKLGRFGYVTLTALEDSLLCEKGDTLAAHEFHYWDSDFCGSSFHASKPQSNRAWDCVIATPTLYAGYPHLYLRSERKAAKRFVAACAQFGQGE